MLVIDPQIRLQFLGSSPVGAGEAVASAEAGIVAGTGVAAGRRVGVGTGPEVLGAADDDADGAVAVAGLLPANCQMTIPAPTTKTPAATTAAPTPTSHGRTFGRSDAGACWSAVSSASANAPMVA